MPVAVFVFLGFSVFFAALFADHWGENKNTFLPFNQAAKRVPSTKSRNVGSIGLRGVQSLVRFLLASSNFIVFPFLPFPACFFLHLSGSGKKQGGTRKGTE
jgi:hypothetical protein